MNEGSAARRAKPVIGLLGAPGAGKSHVAAQFRALCCGVVDADALARAALQSEAVRDQLVQWWGRRVLDEQGGVDRQVVGEIVFNDEAALRRLESVTHPKVHEQRAAWHAQYQSDSDVVAIVEDTPLLLEKDLAGVCDVLVFVAAPRAERLARLRTSRGWSESELARREKSQWPLDNKRERADYVIDNHAGAAEPLEAQCRRVLSRILQSQAQVSGEGR